MSRKNKYTCNDSFFESINTEDKAYWLGVLFADGNTSLNNCGTGVVRLSSKDKDWVENFLKSVSSTNTVHKEIHKKYNKEIWKAMITSHKMFNDLCNLGCVPNKSLVLKFPKIKNELVPHFIRGYFDGDGTVGIYKYLSKSNSVTLRSGIASGSKEFLEELIKYIPIKNKNIKHHDLYTVSFSVKDSLSFYDYVYKDATIFLERKKLKFEEFKQRRSETIIVTPDME